MDLALVPSDPALAPGLCGIFLEPAMLAVDGSEPLAGPELHPPRLLLLVAHATGEQATGVGRSFRLPSFLALLPIRGPIPFPLNNRFRGNPGNPYSDLTLLASISRAIVIAGRPHGFGGAARLLTKDAHDHVLLFFHSGLGMCSDPWLMTKDAQARQSPELGIVIHGEHVRLVIR